MLNYNNNYNDIFFMAGINISPLFKIIQNAMKIFEIQIQEFLNKQSQKHTLITRNIKTTFRIKF